MTVAERIEAAHAEFETLSQDGSDRMRIKELQALLEYLIYAPPSEGE
jgi:hypothetical protein